MKRIYKFRELTIKEKIIRSLDEDVRPSRIIGGFISVLIGMELSKTWSKQ